MNTFINDTHQDKHFICLTCFTSKEIEAPREKSVTCLGAQLKWDLKQVSMASEFQSPPASSLVSAW